MSREQITTIFWYALAVLSIVFFGVFTNFNEIMTPKELQQQAQNLEENPETAVVKIDLIDYYYPLFADQMVFIFIGFSFFLAFMAKYQFAATSYALWIGALTLQWGILIGGFCRNLINDEWHEIKITLATFNDANFATIALLVAFGALLGKVSFNQITFISLAGLIFYYLNRAILEKEFNLQDAGGSVAVYFFGAVFGLATTFTAVRRDRLQRSLDLQNHADIKNKKSHLFSIMGLIFMWVMFPSVNCNFSQISDPNSRARVVINTFLSIAASGTAGIIMTKILRNGQANFLDIEHSTIAGGVAIAASAQLFHESYPALIVGSIAGVLTCLSSKYLQPLFEKKCGLHDSRGVINTFFIGGLVGGFASMIATSQNYESLFGEAAKEDDEKQTEYQLYSLLISFAIACGGGIITGGIVRFLSFDSNEEIIFFKENVEFGVEHEELSTNTEIQSVEDRRQKQH